MEKLDEILKEKRMDRVENWNKEIEEALERLNIKSIEDDDAFATITNGYQEATAYLKRLQIIHNNLAMMEVNNISTLRTRKFRTLIVDKTIDFLEKVASYESRKLTAKQLEWEMSKDR
jgi:hypothetical protein